MTSREAFEFMEQKNKLLQEVATQLKITQIKEIPHKVEALQIEIKNLEQQKGSLEAKFASQQAADIFSNVEKIGGFSIITAKVKVSGMEQLRQLADQWKEKQISDVLVLATATSDGKVNLIAAVVPSAIKAGIKAGELIKEIAPLVGGGGGGRPDMAQAGGKNPAGIAQALEKAKKILEK